MKKNRSKTLLYINLVFVILFATFTQTSFATTEDKDMSIRHFQEQKINGAALASKYNKQAQNVYELSMPLLADSRLYTEANAKRFQALFEKTKSDEYKENKNTQWMTSNEFRLWMQGRELIIAMNAGNIKEAATIASELEKTLTPGIYAPSEYKGASAFAAWALGYLQSYNALHNKSAYQTNKEPLQSAVTYQQQQFDKLQGKEKESFLSDVMWSYAMAIQAASLKKDQKSYNEYMLGLANLSNPKGTAALSIRKLPNDQYPAWLSSIILGAAERMEDPGVPSIRNEFNNAQKRTTQEQDKMMGVATQDFYQTLPEPATSPAVQSKL